MPWILIPLLGLLIPIISLLTTRVYQPWLDLQHRKMKLETDKVAEKAAQYAAHTDRLEQRVRVLERIATDRGADLAHEIDLLRDDRPTRDRSPRDRSPRDQFSRDLPTADEMEQY
ncbi:MAG: hypothetical protein M3R64_05840 [Pseudomonadota bacterium]|nr:hypothetical protein [Pseudomonadota bacterium]